MLFLKANNTLAGFEGPLHGRGKRGWKGRKGAEMTDHRELDWMLTVRVMTRTALAKCNADTYLYRMFPCVSSSQPQPHLAGMYKVMRLVSEILREMCPCVWWFYVTLRWQSGLHVELFLFACETLLRLALAHLSVTLHCFLSSLYIIHNRDDIDCFSHYVLGFLCTTRMRSANFQLTQTFHRWRLLDERCFQLTSRNFYSVTMIKLDSY